MATFTQTRNGDTVVLTNPIGAADDIVLSLASGATPGGYTGPITLSPGQSSLAMNVPAYTQDQIDTGQVVPVCFTCIAAVACVDRMSSLLAGRFGFGAATTGGTEFVQITSLTDDSLLTALTAGDKYICFNPSLDGQVWDAPRDVLQGQAGNNNIEIGANTTIDGRDALVTLQLGDPGTVDYANQQNYKPVRLVWQDGNFYGCGFRVRGDLIPGTVQDPQTVLNGTSDAEIFGGSNYYFDGVTFEYMSDEALSVFHNNGGAPTGITWTNLRFRDNKNDSLIGSIASGGPVGTITQAYNWSTGAVEGRAPGFYTNMHAHSYNNVAEDYNREGISVWNNAEVISECNVLDPGCRTNAHQLRVGNNLNTNFSGVAGKLNDSGSFAISQGGTPGCFTSQDANFNEPLANMFSIPYAYTKQGGTTEESIRSYVLLNAGAEAKDRTQVFCDEVGKVAG